MVKESERWRCDVRYAEMCTSVFVEGVRWGGFRRFLMNVDVDADVESIFLAGRG